MRARLVAAAAAATLPIVLALCGGTPAVAGQGGNKGSLKVSEVDGAADRSNDPHVGCTFDLQWYGFQRSTATVSFASQAPTKSAVITKVAGPDSVELGAATSGGVMNSRRTYTLSFTGADPQANQGYKVKVTTKATGANGAESKHKVFWVECDRADVTTPTDPGTEDPGTEDPGTEDPGTEDPGTEEPFSWDWEYDNPACDALTVDYPWDIPAGQANDANIRFQTATGQFTLNFHNNASTWSGTHVFDFPSHPQWPAGLTTYHVVWVQVGGTNYHWQGDVSCVVEDGVAKAATEVQGFRTGSLTIDRGASVAADSVVVNGSGISTGDPTGTLTVRVR